MSGSECKHLRCETQLLRKKWGETNESPVLLLARHSPHTCSGRNERQSVNTHTGVHTHDDINYSRYECAPVASWDMHLNVKNMTTWFLTVISNYNPHFSPLQAALHLGQITFMSKTVSKQTVPWGWIAVIKPGDCYEPYEKDTEIMLWILQIPATLLFVPLQQLFKGYYSKCSKVQCNYKHREK